MEPVSLAASLIVIVHVALRSASALVKYAHDIWEASTETL